MVVDKRADIVILSPEQLKVPVELKRDYHPDLWTACTEQLDRLYTRDRESSGYGVYGVFWFGDKRTRSIPKSIDGHGAPTSPEELEERLSSLIDPDKRHRLHVVVIDVTKPPG